MSDARNRAVRELVGELEGRFHYAAALLSGAEGVQIRDNGGEQSATQEPPSQGIVFTVYDGAAFVEYATGEHDADTLVRAIRRWAQTLTRRTDGPPIVGGGYAAVLGPDERHFEVPVQTPLSAVSLAEKLAYMRDLQRYTAGLDTRIVQVQVRYQERTERKTYIGRGRLLTQRVPRVTISLLVAVSDGAQVRYHFLQRGGTAGFELARLEDADLRQTADVALRLLAAERITPGEYDVVTDPSVSGVIAHECFGHGVELDLFPKGRARAAQYLDQRVAAPAVQMYDDPSVFGAYGSYFFDDEGELARPTQILRDGVLVRPISDFASATFTPGIHTPNGRRQDFTRKTYARMSNTYFTAGAADPRALLASVERGIYLRQAESGMEDPMGWGVQVTAHYGEEIVHGQLTGRLYAPVGLTGYVPDLLGSISGIGSDFELSPGTCGKGQKEMVAVSSGGPHLRMKARLG